MLRSWLLALTTILLISCTTPQSKVTAPATTTVQSVITTSNDLAAVLEILNSGHYRHTLLVLDIDDTLLTSASFFGSDAWYEWQKSLAPSSPDYVPCHFDVLAMNYESGTQVPTQPEAVALINSIQTDKLILTARSDLYRSGTIRELKHAGYVLPRSLQPAVDGLAYRWQRDAKSVPIVVNYRDGVFMIAGQDKGILLLDLLRRLNVSYDRVVLVDDGEKNHNAMRDALASTGIAYHGLHYTRVSKAIDEQKVQAGIAGWAGWQQLLSRVYPERLHRLQANSCAF